MNFTVLIGGLTLSLLMLHICGVSKMFGEWKFWKLSAKVSLGIDRRTAVTSFWIAAAVLYERCQPCVVKDGDYFEGQ
jgi:hypothetical protein